MNNGLGINFFRYLKEEDDTSWCQVFAKIPFDDLEIEQKGALFGVVKQKKSESWSDTEMEMTNWVDTYFNGLNEKGPLANYYEDFVKAYPEIESVWVWILDEFGKRKIKVVGKGNLVAFVKRGDRKIGLVESLLSEKVIVGELLLDDTFVFGVGKLDTVEDLDSLLEEDSYGFFKIEVDEKKSKEDANDFLVEDVEEIKVDQPPVREKQVEEDLVTNKYLVKPTLRQRIASLFPKKDQLVVANDISKERRKKIAFLTGILFMGMLILSLVLGGFKKNEAEKLKKWTNFSEPIEKMISEAVGIAKINQPSAKKMIEEAKDKYEKGKMEFENDEDLNSLEKKISEAWAVVSGEVNAQLAEQLNLELIRSGVNASRLNISDGSDLSILSSDSGLVMTADLKTKAIKVVAGKGAGLGWIDSVLFKDNSYVMSKSSVFMVGNENNPVVFDTAVTDPVAMSVFGTGIYILERGNKEIFKYSILDGGFGDRQRWLKDGEILQNTPIDMDIDVDIWVLEEKGLLERFRRGVKEQFSLTGLNADTEFVKVAVETEGDRIALLSTSQSTIVLCSKETGKCEKQLKNPKLAEARDIVFGYDGSLNVLFANTVEMIN